MKLPAHKYYSLDKAAKLAGCEVLRDPLIISPKRNHV